MYANYMFPFRIGKEVGFAIDENGDNSDAFIQIYFKKVKKEITQQRYKVMHQEFIGSLSKQLNCDPKYIVPISGQEYEENTEEE